MKINSFFSFPLLAGLAVVLMFSSCKEDPPEADFTFSADGLTLTFENFSKNATSYAWSFGDGNASTSEDASNTYAAEGTYTVQLIATGDGGTNTYSEDIIVSKPSIQIDADFSDWDAYDTYYTRPDTTTGTLLEAKVTAKNGFLYFYLRATADAGPAVQVFIDGDNDPATGWGFWGKYETPGLEYLLEVVLEEFTGQYGLSTPKSVLLVADEMDWPWNTFLAETDAVTDHTGWVTVGSEKILEFSVAKSLMPNFGATVRMVFVNADIDWEDAGTLPNGWEDPALPLLPINL